MVLVQNVKSSIYSFLLGCSVLLLYAALTCDGDTNEATHGTSGSLWLTSALVAGYAFFIVIIVLALSTKETFGVTIRGSVLGLTLGLSTILAQSTSTLRLVGWFVAALSFFHWSEYIATGVTNPRNLSLSSYILDHSVEYHAAIAASLAEFFIESYLFPIWKQPNACSLVGLAVVLGGELLRKLAMWHASTNFNHYIRYRREDGHRLVTSGVYAWVRHPSYVGWFYWSIATQVMILNPVCAILYALCSWKFFHDRVLEEEKTLVSFFGQQYVEYQHRVGTGLPFITGFTLKDHHHDCSGGDATF